MDSDERRPRSPESDKRPERGETSIREDYADLPGEPEQKWPPPPEEPPDRPPEPSKPEPPDEE
jgi:hypothetical protein